MRRRHGSGRTSAASYPTISNARPVPADRSSRPSSRRRSRWTRCPALRRLAGAERAGTRLRPCYAGGGRSPGRSNSACRTSLPSSSSPVSPISPRRRTGGGSPTSSPSTRSTSASPARTASSIPGSSISPRAGRPPGSSERRHHGSGRRQSSLPHRWVVARAHAPLFAIAAGDPGLPYAGGSLRVLIRDIDSGHEEAVDELPGMTFSHASRRRVKSLSSVLPLDGNFRDLHHRPAHSRYASCDQQRRDRYASPSVCARRPPDRVQLRSAAVRNSSTSWTPTARTCSGSAMAKAATSRRPGLRAAISSRSPSLSGGRSFTSA